MEDFMSIYDYLGKAGGGDLGKAVFARAKRKNIPMRNREVQNTKYTGKVILYPKMFLDGFFEEGSKLPF